MIPSADNDASVERTAVNRCYRCGGNKVLVEDLDSCIECLTDDEADELGLP